MKEVSVLILDDHPLILEAYTMAFRCLANEELTYTIEMKSSIEATMDMITSGKKFDLFLLDIRLPKSEKYQMTSGEDVAVYVREHLDAKIIITTTITSNYRLFNILKGIDPDGFMIKSDVNSEVLQECIQQVMQNPPYYSPTVLQLIRKQLAHDFLLDKIDRQILFELAEGTKMRDLPKVVPMSIGGIERRKRQLREIFNISKGGDKALVAMAKDKGFL